jgi:murein L,D-transpeptidase YafK
MGKTKEGDNKVPLGSYRLGEARPSEKFWRFIPIGYPTIEQRRRGLTGGKVGIHGPHRRARWLGSILRWFDTTHGCIGLAYDEEMDDIIAWLRETKAYSVHIE